MGTTQLDIAVARREAELQQREVEDVDLPVAAFDSDLSSVGAHFGSAF